MTPNSRRITWYGLVVCLSSALLLALEIVAGRLIAPYVGVSLYTWTAVIGVVLAGLSAGNWLGGVWADRGGNERGAGLVLLAAALATLAIPLLLSLSGGPIQDSTLSLMSASLLLVLSLFFFPALLLGVITPLLTTLSLRLSHRTGRIVGAMHALAAVGSILGTFLAGYWWIPSFGSLAVVVGSAIALAVLGVVTLGSRPVVPAAAVVLIGSVLAVLTGARQGFATACEQESAYFCIRTVDEPWDVPPGRLRTLVLDHLIHGSNHDTEPGFLAAPYVQLMDELAARRLGDRSQPSAFFVGGGAYTLPRAFRARFPAAKIRVAELDPKVTEVARNRLFLDAKDIDIQHRDARVALAADRSVRYDLIVGDAFHDIAVPYHLVTLEFAELVAERLTPSGLYLINVVDAFPDGRLVKALFKTLSAVFPDVHVWLDSLPESPARVTYVVSAGHDHDPPELLRATTGLPRQWLRITDPMRVIGTPLDELPVLTDDHAPVETLVSELFLGPLGR